MSKGITSTKNEISITSHLEKFQAVLGATQIPVLAIMATIHDIASEIKASLMLQEDLAAKDGITPILECNNTECYMWAIAILSSAWTQWVFNSKSLSAYQADPTHPEASKNVKIALPYIKTSLIDTIYAGEDIGRNHDANYVPDAKKHNVTFRLRKNNQQSQNSFETKKEG